MSDFWFEFCARRGAGEEYLLAKQKGTEADVIRKIANSESEGEIKPPEAKGGKIKMTSTWFPNTAGMGKKEEGKGWFPKTDFPEEIEFTTPALKGESRSHLMSMHHDEFPGFVADRLEGAFTNSHSGTVKTLDWFIGVADGGEFFDRAALKEMKGFRKELGEAIEYPERKAILEKTVKYLRGMKTQGR
jgi:hypothetical protein